METSCYIKVKQGEVKGVLSLQQLDNVECSILDHFIGIVGWAKESCHRGGWGFKVETTVMKSIVAKCS